MIETLIYPTVKHLSVGSLVGIDHKGIGRYAHHKQAGVVVASDNKSTRIQLNGQAFLNCDIRFNIISGIRELTENEKIKTGILTSDASFLPGDYNLIIAPQTTSETDGTTSISTEIFNRGSISTPGIRTYTNSFRLVSKDGKGGLKILIRVEDMLLLQNSYYHYKKVMSGEIVEIKQGIIDTSKDSVNALSLSSNVAYGGSASSLEITTIAGLYED